MAKLTVDQAKTELSIVEKAIEGLKGMNIPVPAQLQESYDKFMKIINGNASANVATLLQDKLAAAINSEKNTELREALAKAIGKSVKVSIVVVTDEETGAQTIKFETASTGGAKPGTSSGGGTKAATAHNHYKVVNTSKLPEYAQHEAEFKSASAVVGFILNNGKNPMNLGAEWQKGNSMVRALESLQKNEVFAANFTVEASYVAPAEKPATTEAAAETTEEAGK